MPVDALRQQALKLLEGVGDPMRGQWVEYGDRAYHLRRRLSEREALRVGPVVDVRGTPEQELRWRAIRKHLPVGYENYRL